MKICYLPSDMDGPGFYRCLSPGRQLGEHGWNVFMPEYTSHELENGKILNEFKIDLDWPRGSDLYVLQQRKERIWAESGIARLRYMGMATVMDVDDDYVNLPEYNPAFYGTHPYIRNDGVILNRQERRRIKKQTGFKPTPNPTNHFHLNDSIAQVDLLTVSTPRLAEVYSKWNNNIQVVRNYVDWDIWDDIQPQYEVERERIRIGYLGVFRYRRGDLTVIQRVLPKFLRDHPEVDFVANSEETHNYLGIPEEQRITIGEYTFQALDGDLPLGRMTAVCDIGLVPLAVNDLNQSKSHLKGMEYNAAGIPFIASPTESYRDYWCDESNGFLATEEEDWYYAMEAYVGDEKLRRRHGQAGREKAHAHSIQKNWRVWDTVYRNLLGGEHHAIARKALSVGAIQKTSELGPFLSFASKIEPKVVVEIGTALGGTLWALSQVAAEDATFVSIDIPAGSPIDTQNGKDAYQGRNRERIKHLLKPTQSLVLIDLDSQLSVTEEVLARALDGKKIDLLFIDGDHRYEGVKHDYETYSKYVREGGIIAFHDIRAHHDKRAGVDRLWKEIPGGVEFMGPESWGYVDWGGIGAVYA